MQDAFARAFLEAKHCEILSKKESSYELGLTFRRAYSLSRGLNLQILALQGDLLSCDGFFLLNVNIIVGGLCNAAVTKSGDSVL